MKWLNTPAHARWLELGAPQQLTRAQTEWLRQSAELELLTIIAELAAGRGDRPPLHADLGIQPALTKPIGQLANVDASDMSSDRMVGFSGRHRAKLNDQ
jgi:hypothetical protein